MENTKKPVYKITLAAIFIALGTVLSMFKPIEMPLGGGVTVMSMVPVVMMVLLLGNKWGFIATFVYSLIQMGLSFVEVMGWGLTPVSLIVTFLFEYIIAYTVLGFSGIFRRKGTVGIVIGVCLAVFLRFICHFITGGAIFDIWCEWDNAWWYSFCYNGAYMLPEMVITAIASALIFRIPQIKKYIA